jgi:hypothetical protein
MIEDMRMRKYSSGPPPIFITSKICGQRKLKRRGRKYGGQSTLTVCLCAANLMEGPHSDGR